MTVRQEKLLLSGLFALVMPPSFIGVAAIGSARSVPAPPWLVTPLDTALPLVPAAVWAYASWYPASLVVLLARRERFRRASLAEFGAFLACSAVHLLWPVSIDRPPLDGYAGLSAAALRVLYAVDRPVSLFPSFHAAVAPILLQLRPPSRALRIGLAVWMTSICASCVLTKQHYVLDVFAGITVGWSAGALVDVVSRTWRRSAKPSSAAPSTARPRGAPRRGGVG